MIDDINIYWRLQKHSSWLVRREREPFARFVFIRPPILSLISTRPPPRPPHHHQDFYLFSPHLSSSNFINLQTQQISQIVEYFGSILWWTFTGDFPEHFNCTSCHEMLQMLQNVHQKYCIWDHHEMRQMLQNVLQRHCIWGHQKGNGEVYMFQSFWWDFPFSLFV